MEFSPGFLTTLVDNANIVWNFLPAENTAGGILVGINEELFDVLVWTIRSFTVSCSIKNKQDGFEWQMTVVYGSSYEEHTQAFLDELSEICDDCNLPMLIGGDFNLIREAHGKSNVNINLSWSNKFNDWINAAALMELKLANRQFTWSNN